MTAIYCKNERCTWYQRVANPLVHICTRKGEVLCLNEKGKCALFVEKKHAKCLSNFCSSCGRDLQNSDSEKLRPDEEGKCALRMIYCKEECLWFIRKDKHANRNFCPYCGRI